MDLKGKKILITGGGSGLGRGYVETLRSQGAQVIYADVKDPGDLPGFFHCDVSSWESQLELFAKAVQELGRLDAVVANAGIGGGEEFNEFEDVSVDPPTRPRTKIIDVNFTGVLFTAKLALHQFAKQQQAGQNDPSFAPIIVLGGSLGGYFDFPMCPIYSATKFSVRGLLHSIRHTVPRIGARAGMIAPWHIQTPMLDTGGFSDYLKQLGIPLGTLDDVVSAVVDLIRDPKSSGRCYAAVPRTEKAPKGYFDVEEPGQEKFWKEYNDMLVSEDTRPIGQQSVLEKAGSGA